MSAGRGLAAVEFKKTGETTYTFKLPEAFPSLFLKEGNYRSVLNCR